MYLFRRLGVKSYSAIAVLVMLIAGVTWYLLNRSSSTPVSTNVTADANVKAEADVKAEANVTAEANVKAEAEDDFSSDFATDMYGGGGGGGAARAAIDTSGPEWQTNEAQAPVVQTQTQSAVTQAQNAVTQTQSAPTQTQSAPAQAQSAVTQAQTAPLSSEGTATTAAALQTTTVNLCNPTKTVACARKGSVLTCEEYDSCMRLNSALPCNDEWFAKCGYDTLQVSMWCQAFNGLKVYLNGSAVSYKAKYGSTEVPVQYYEFIAKPGNVVKFVVDAGIFRLGGLRCSMVATSKLSKQWYYTDIGGAFVSTRTYTANKIYTATGLPKVALTKSTQPGLNVRTKLVAADNNVSALQPTDKQQEYQKAVMIWVQTPATFSVVTEFEVKLQ